MDFFDQLDVEYTSDTKRKTFRVSMPALEVTIKDKPGKFPTQNISSGGVRFNFSRDNDPGLKKGQTILLSLIIKKRLFLEDLSAVVVNIQEDQAACEFRDIPLRQEAYLDKLVLEVQKRMIRLNRKTKIQDNSHEDK